MSEEARIVTAERVVHADAASIFELIAEPAQQPRWDGNANLTEAAAGQRVRGVGDVFVMRIHNGQLRDNHVVEFEEGRRIAWLPAPEGERTPGHLWRWELEPREGGTLVRHTYDWTGLGDDPMRVERARSTGEDRLLASIERLAATAEAESVQSVQS